MKKILFLLITFSFTINLPLVAQGGVIERIFNLFSGNKADTLYAVRSEYPFRIKARTTTAINTADFSWEEPQNNISLLAQPVFKVGAHISYRNIGIGFQKDVGNLFSKSDDYNIEVSASAYGRKFGGDFSYSTSNNFILKTFNRIILNRDVEGVKSRRMYANCYYVFNNKRYSYPAALTQSYHQKKSCGSVIVGLSFLNNSIELNPKRLSEATDGEVPVSHIMHRSTYRCLNFNAGYAYNWVVGRHWLFHCTALPSVSIFNKLEYKLANETSNKRNNTDFGGIIRMGALWDYRRCFASFTALTYVNGTKYNSMEMTEMYTKIHLSFGVRF